ncbi:MAG TPA: polyprenol monophosphomannose synthase [Ignavibacteria bacterium]|nr:polyprenol monophosphomannose synthase [Ignavibacteria bacterium]
MNNILVIIPTYNESENIKNIIQEVLKHSDNENRYNVLVVDDNSPDGTAKIVKEMQTENIYLIERPAKAGLGTAYVTGFKFAIEKGFDYVFEMDADFSHDPKYLPEFIKKLDAGYDLVVGSRYINGISVVNWPLSRLFLSYFANIYTRIITGLKVKDTTAGFACYRVKKLSEINLEKIKSNGYSFQIEMKFIFYKKGFKITEIPIMFIDRRAGKSKMSKSVVYESIFMVWKLKFRSILGKL